MQRHTVRFTQLNASGKFTLQYYPRYISPDSSVTGFGNDFFFVHRYPFFIDRAAIVSSERDVPYLAFFSCSSEVLSSVQGYTNMRVYVSL